MTYTHTRTASLLFAVCALAPAAAAAQQQPGPVAEQIAGAVLPLPEDQRAGATVMGYRTAGQLSVLRQGTGDMICLADEPGNETYHVACWHDSLEPLMAMGRELAARGIQDPQRDSMRAAAATDGRLQMPEAPAAFHSLTGPVASWNPRDGTFVGASKLHTVYIPWATTESTGLSTAPAGGGQPWLMFPGSYRAHIMIVPGGA
jgi:hypothetical protein